MKRWFIEKLSDRARAAVLLSFLMCFAIGALVVVSVHESAQAKDQALEVNKTLETKRNETLRDVFKCREMLRVVRAEKASEARARTSAPVYFLPVEDRERIAAQKLERALDQALEIEIARAEMLERIIKKRSD